MSYDLREDGTTQTLLQLWLGCRKAARYKTDGWHTEKSKAALNIGDTFHKALEIAHNQIRNTKLDISSILEWIVRQTVAIQQNANSTEDVNAVEKDSAMLSALVSSYFKYWTDDLSKDRWYAAEEQFSVLWNGVRLRGKVDGLVNIGSDIYLLETKTASQISTSISDALCVDFQTLLYHLCAELHIGRPIKGVIYDIARKPALRQLKETKKHEAESFIDYTVRIHNSVMENPADYFSRFEITHSANDMLMFKEDLKHIVTDYKVWCSGGMPTYRSFAKCTGRWDCEYLGMCASGSTAGYYQDNIVFPELEGR